MKKIFVIACLLGLTSVILGAAGDHLLEGRLTPNIAERFAVALHYHQLYSIVLLALSLYGMEEARGRVFTVAAGAFLAGTLIFSGSLYLSIFLSLPAFTFGTPVGGITLMAGWIALAAYGLCRVRA